MIATPFPNQPPPYEGRNLYRADAALQEAVEREGALAANSELDRWGETLGSADSFALADAANRFPPRLLTHDRRGERIDTVEFHPAWHELMRLATASTARRGSPRTPAHRWLAPRCISCTRRSRTARNAR
jgi:Adaptive response protein AidB N-terminal domain